MLRGTDIEVQGFKVSRFQGFEVQGFKVSRFQGFMNFHGFKVSRLKNMHMSTDQNDSQMILKCPSDDPKMTFG